MIAAGVELVDDTLAFFNRNVLDVVVKHELVQFSTGDVVIMVRVDSVKQGSWVEFSNLRKVLTKTFNLENSMRWEGYLPVTLQTRLF